MKKTITFEQLRRLVKESLVRESEQDEVEVDEPDVPDIDYDHPNSEDCSKLAEFLRKSGLMPKTKVQHAGANDWGKWDVMVGPISDYEDGYILFYWWADTFDEHADRYLFFLKDGVANNYEYTFEKNPKILAELDRIVDVFGKSKKWKDE